MPLGKTLVALFAVSLIFSSTSSPKTNQASQQVAMQSSSSTLGTTLGPNQVSVTPPTQEEAQITVRRVVDGDTIELSTGQRLRYIGIDTPETNGGCFSLEAKLANEQLVLNKPVRLEKDVSETDRYGRLLRYVWVGETFVNDQLVR